MNKEQLWAFLIQQNRRLTTDPHFTPDSVRQFFELIWNMAYSSASRDWVDRHKEMSGEMSGEMTSDDAIQFGEIMEVLAEIVAKKDAEEDTQR